MGGMKAIAWTNGLMAVGMAVGAVMILIAVFDHTSLTDLMSRLSSIDRELVSPSTGTPYGDSRFSAFLVLPYAFLFTMCLPYMASRILAFRKDVTMYDAALVVAILTCILSVTPVAGLYARAYMEPLADPDQAIIAVINELLGPFTRAFIGLSILFAIQTIGSAASHDLRKALVPEKELPQSRVLFIDRATVFIFGILAVIGMLFAPPFMLVWLGILGTGSLLASFAVPVFFSSFWQGNGYGTLAAMLSGLTVSATMLLYFESGWIEGPLLGCVVSAVAYYLVSVATFSRQPRRG
jgi:sodium/pantothenate symporter